MKKFIILVFASFLALNALAQLEVKEGSFRMVPGFVNTNPDPDYQTDDNYYPFAIIKIKTEGLDDKQRRELLFQGNAATYFMLEYKQDEIWLYLTAKYADYIKFSHRDLSTLEYTLPEQLKPNQGYELTLVNTNTKVAKYGSITVTTTPKDQADITLDGKVLEQKTPYTNDAIIVGQHEITVSKFPYAPTTKIVDIKEGEHLNLEIFMPFSYGTLTIETTPPGATVIIDKKEYGTTPITIDTLVVGNHFIMLKKDGLKLMTEKINLNHDTPINIKKTFETCPVGAIDGVFSVSDTSQVYFSQGNLQYQPSTKIWRFAGHQGYFIGKDNKKASEKNSGWVDWFAWNTANNPMSRSKNSQDYKGDKFVDWGHNPISNGGNTPDMWRTLSNDEWDYLFFKRKTSSVINSAIALVNGIYGMIILPDNWNVGLYDLKGFKGGGFSSSYGPGGYTIESSISNPKENVISLSDWKNIFEANGAVFLPAAGYDNINLKMKDDYIGAYWTSPSLDNQLHYEKYVQPDRFSKDNKFRVGFWSLYSGSGFEIYPENRLSVRLVH
ncbi:MAG: PEGA domain-containing protein [Bacteroidales bacterium]|nr:PEGA domain-containing protein [Bacteroidales bacterium]